jgi:hypothetical protein
LGERFEISGFPKIFLLNKETGYIFRGGRRVDLFINFLQEYERFQNFTIGPPVPKLDGIRFIRKFYILIGLDQFIPHWLQVNF